MLNQCLTIGYSPAFHGGMTITRIPRRILIVEDDEVSAHVARTLLQKLGCIVDIAVTGADGVARFGKTPYDLVLMDWLMPKMNGLEATARIRHALVPLADTNS